MSVKSTVAMVAPDETKRSLGGEQLQADVDASVG